MATIHFYKMHGAGNDFVLVDGLSQRLPKDLTSFIRKICKRHTGADGLMIIAHHPHLGFQLSYYNADGSEGEMCGNGARCAVALAYRLGIVGKEATFEIQGVSYQASVEGAEQIRIFMHQAKLLKPAEKLTHLLTSEYRSMLLLEVGVPHLIAEVVGDLSRVNVEIEGRRLREHPDFLPRGCNVNFVSRTSGERIKIRTYERGVEAETLACGTGAVAAAAFFKMQYGLEWPLLVQPPGGLLSIDHSEGGCSLSGPAILVFEGHVETLEDKQL